MPLDQCAAREARRANPDGVILSLCDGRYWADGRDAQIVRLAMRLTGGATGGVGIPADQLQLALAAIVKAAYRVAIVEPVA